MNSTYATECNVTEAATCEFSGVITTESVLYFNPTSKRKGTISFVSYKDGFMYSFTDEICNEFPHITALEVTHSYLQYIEKGSLKKCTEVVFLSFEGNELKIVDDDLLLSNTKLEIVSFYDNHLISVDLLMFSHLRQLTILNLGGNNIIHVDFLRTKRLPLLTELVIVENFLVDLDLENMLKVFPRLSNLLISENFLECTRLEKVFTTLNESRVRVVALNEDQKRISYTFASVLNSTIDRCLNESDYKRMLVTRLHDTLQENKNLKWMKHQVVVLEKQLRQQLDMIYVFVVGGICIGLVVVAVILGICLYKSKRFRDRLVSNGYYYYYTNGVEQLGQALSLQNR